MCKHGDTECVRVRIPADLSGTGQARWKHAAIDACIADLVRALQIGEIHTCASCCGHGRMCGNICLQDGRVLLVIPAAETDALFTDRKVSWFLDEARRRARYFGERAESFDCGAAPAGLLTDQELSALIEACNVARSGSRPRPPWNTDGDSAHKKLLAVEAARQSEHGRRRNEARKATP